MFAELVVAMAEPSLLCVSCARAPPPHRRTWGRCTVCVERNLPSTYYCGEECMNAHWHNGHKEWHKEQKERAKELRQGTVLEGDRSLAEAEARRAEATGDEYDKRCAASLALEDLHAEAKAWRKIIKQWPHKPAPYFNLATVLDQSDRNVESAQMYLKAMELSEDVTEGWALAASGAFDLLKTPNCDEMPKPEWWNDEGLKALSARVVAIVPDESSTCSMRARVLSGGSISTGLSAASWNAGQRTAAEIKEAATWFRRAAVVERTPSCKLRYDKAARECDEYADPLLAKEEAAAAAARAAEEAEAAKARAAAEAEVAKALKVAEAKAAAAAEELLAEEEKEKQQASTKAGKAPKGKKGKGRR